MMRITKKWLESKGACEDDVIWFTKQGLSDSVSILTALIKENKLDFANWFIVNVMTRPQYLAYAIYSAEQVIDIFEKKYPFDDSPRLAIKAAKAVLKNDTAENRAASWLARVEASWAARAAGWAVRGEAREEVGWEAREEVGWAAREEERAAASWAAAWAASCAASCAARGEAREAASCAASEAMEAARAKTGTQTRIFKYGLTLLEVK